MNQSKTERFDSAAEGVCLRLRKRLFALPPVLKAHAQEIRLRVGRPVSVCCPEGTYFLCDSGKAAPFLSAGMTEASQEDVQETFQILCENSVYSHENEIRNGYITMRGGHRAGLCGTAVLGDGAVTGMRDVSSICLRVARELPGCADELLDRVGKSLEKGLLLAGPPASGKTTILRDVARQLSGGMRGCFCKVCVVDERSEIAAAFRGVPQNDVGVCCDVLDGCPKSVGILMAVRSLSPRFIVCDELGGEAETRAVEQSLNAGVGVIASIHAGSAEELVRRRQASALLETGAFGSVALLSGAARPGKIAEIYRTGDLLAEAHRRAASDCGGQLCGVYGIAQALPARGKA